MIHIPTISKGQLSTWVSFLKKDAEKNGGTGSMLFVCEGENIKVTCWKDLVITEIFSDADFLQLQSLFADDEGAAIVEVPHILNLP